MRVLCLGIHGTLRAGGAGAGAGATGFSGRKEPVGFLEQMTRKECSRTCQGPKNVLLCSEVLEERIRRRGVCLVGGFSGHEEDGVVG